VNSAVLASRNVVRIRAPNKRLARCQRGCGAIVAMGEMEEIKKNDFNLNISRYISTAVGETEIVLEKVHDELTAAETAIREKTKLHNTFLKELGLHLLPRP
jgi:hypothetical protein